MGLVFSLRTPVMCFKHCLKHSFFLCEEFLMGKGWESRDPESLQAANGAIKTSFGAGSFLIGDNLQKGLSFYKLKNKT